MEKEFISASEFVVGGGGNGLGSDVLMELYGLHKIATEGPCHEPQPMPLKLNARAKCDYIVQGMLGKSWET